MKNKILIYLSLFFLVSSCGILDQESPDNANADNVLGSADGLRAARTGLYSLMCNEYYYGGYYPLALDAHSDNGTTGGYVVVSLTELGDKKVTPANIFVERIWTSIYSGVNAANQILANVDTNTELEPAERDNIKGEALVVRALGHFDALKMYGEHWDNSSVYGVPVATRPQGATDKLGRSDVKTVYQQITKDLTDAIPLLNGDDEKGRIYITADAARGLLARVALFAGDKTLALMYAKGFVDNAKEYALFDVADFGKLYTERQTSESIFELKFDIQNRSAYNSLTYKRDAALRPEVNFFAAADLNNFFKQNPADVRATTIDFVNNSSDILPDGRSQKYRGESLQDNPAYILRVAEMYLIAAEAEGYPKGLESINGLRKKRGLKDLTTADVPNQAAFVEALLAEHRAEFNMEGHRFTDLTRLRKAATYINKDVLEVFPIPLREIGATGGLLKQYPGY